MNKPEIIYKYRSWTDKYDKRILTNFELFLASPKDFNDPFDCQLHMRYDSLSESEIESYASNIASKKYTRDQEEHKKLKFKITHYLKNEPDKFQEEYEKESTESFNNFYGVLSMSIDWNNILMWSHYADKHQGFVVGFKEKQLFASDLFTGDFVKYPDNRDYPTISPFEGDGMERHLKTVYHKSVDWKYENEYRLAKIFRPPIIPNEEDRKIYFAPSLIEEVIIGLNICPYHKSEILNICKKHTIKVFQAQRVKSKFLLDRKPIGY